MLDDQYYRAALKFVNDFRVELLKLDPLPELPQGDQRSTRACPVAKGVRQGTKWAGYANASVVQVFPHFRVTPYEVALFLGRFDRGLYPELIRQTPP